MTETSTMTSMTPVTSMNPTDSMPLGDSWTSSSETAKESLVSTEPLTTSLPPMASSNYTERWGVPLDTHKSCMNIPKEANTGASFMDVISFLSDKMKPSMNYTIDKYGCSQIQCLGDRGILKLCNLKPMTGSFVWTPEDIKSMTLDLLKLWRPEWRTDMVQAKLNIDMQTTTKCERSYMHMHMMKKKDMGHKHGKRTVRTKNTGPLPTHYRACDKPMTITGDDDNLGYLKRLVEGSMEKSAMRSDMLAGMIMNSELGWALAIDSPMGNTTMCDNEDDIVGGPKGPCMMGQGKPEECDWDYTMPPLLTEKYI
ncbi:hypothetical protein ABW20_dc0105477 [Dactylellina cionopaga]|nr:hypothetical protein ABW20_dc0105477 [Dactylellina cionopaga]